MKNYFLKLILSLVVISFLVPLIAEAFIVRIENPLEADTFVELIEKIIDFLYYISFWGIGPIMIVVAGYYFITAMGQPEKIMTAKRIILWTLIGLLIVISAKGLIELLKDIFGIGP